jgi:DNA-binding transcriptional ArsR family regulator/rhodanese-related sulfurtransferase
MRPKSTFDTTETRVARGRLFAEAAAVAALASSPVRIHILSLLAQSPRTVEALAQALGESVANTSQHLRKLAQGNLLNVQKDGTHRVYDLASASVHRFVGALQELTAELSPTARDEEERLVPSALRAQLSLGEAARLANDRQAVLVDVRSLEEAKARPVEGSINVPVFALEDLPRVAERIGEQPNGLGHSDALAPAIPVYVFCRGRMCVTAARTATFLREKGYEAWCVRQTGLDHSQS